MLKLAVLELLGGAIVFGVASHWTAPFVARVIGGAVGHGGVLLRLIGWCFGGLPWVVIGLLAFTFPLVLIRGLVPHVLAVPIAANATVLPSRPSHRSGDDAARRTFGALAAGLGLAVTVSVPNTA